MTKFVYLFGAENTEGDAHQRDLLGGKGANLAEMARLGLPVPPGFTLTTQACNAYLQEEDFPEGMWEEVQGNLKELETAMELSFSDPARPLLLSVRSGAKFSMPGMMDTVLNLGLNDESVEGLAGLTDNPRFAYDAYRRLIQMFAKVVKDLPGEPFEKILETHKAQTPGGRDTDLTEDQLKSIVAEFKELYSESQTEPFPQDPQEQLRQSIAAVFASWHGKRAIDYRNFHDLPHDLGTGCNIQAMVFGNMGEGSATGVAFTRNPATGEKELYGEYLMNAQGEDVVAGIRTPIPIIELKGEMAEVFAQFEQVCKTLELHYRDTQDVEFTVQKDKLWMLQTRTGKRTAAAAVRIAVEMANEGLISQEEALLRVEPASINQLLLPRFVQEAKVKAQEEGKLLAQGLNASPGGATGQAVFTADSAEEWAEQGKEVILVRPETNPDDVHGMLVAKGILTQHGGATSHAAVVARGLGKPCVSGCETLEIDDRKRTLTVGDSVIREGDHLSLDGTTGEVFAGEIATIQPDISKEPHLQTLLEWADEQRRLGVWANADYPKDAQIARGFGAEGIGLCRTEHMFFEAERLPVVQRMILAATDEKRESCLAELLPLQREEFEGLFRAMEGHPVIIRLLDPPLHEFLPRYPNLMAEVARLSVSEPEGELLKEKQALLETVEDHREANPMLGLRGIRLGLMMPGIIRMQTRAIIEAAANVAAEGYPVRPEIMIPLVSHVNELTRTKELLEPVAKAVMEEKQTEVDYKFGTMIEIPRATLTAGQIAGVAQFFSFGTNDLTQTVYGYSRDDAEGKFLLKYVEDGVLPVNPFQTLDQEGIGRLVRLGVEEGRQANPELEVGICGEHGGDPASIAFFHQTGLDYVSCSPYRVPVARLAAAQAALSERHSITRDV